MAKNRKFINDDGFRSDLVIGAKFEGIFEFPSIKRPDKIELPSDIIPFTSIVRTDNYKEVVAFYEHDKKFSEVINKTEEYIEEFKKFKGIISPDCSLYRDDPLSVQIANTYLNRAVGYFLQKNGLYVIPTVRWGDERSYTKIIFNEKFAFVGLPKKSIISVSTYGCIDSREDKYYFREGLVAMLKELEPIIVIVHGAMPKSVFTQFKDQTRFVHYDDWIKKKRGHK